jgi:calcineurin-like phosphoesterase family protein
VAKLKIQSKSRKPGKKASTFRQKKKTSPLLIITSFLLLSLGLILTLVMLRNGQDTRQFAASDSFTFSAAGDYDIKDNFKKNVSTLGSKNDPDFALVLGDFAYTPNKEKEWCSYWKQHVKNVILITGNHDSGGEGKGGVLATYAQHCQFPFKGLKGTYGQQYYFDYPTAKPTARFILISPGIEGQEDQYRKNNKGYDFTNNAIDDARKQNIPWIIVGFHKNCITAGIDGVCEIEKDLQDLLVAKKVDLVLQGHDHSYQRSKQLSCVSEGKYRKECIVDSDSDLVKGAGTIIQIIGTGGRKLFSIDEQDKEYPYFAATNGNTLGTGMFTVSPTALSFRFENSDGEKFDDPFTITAKAGTTPAPTLSEDELTPAPTDTDEQKVKNKKKLERKEKDEDKVERKRADEQSKRDRDKPKRDRNTKRTDSNERKSPLEILQDLIFRNR